MGVQQQLENLLLRKAKDFVRKMQADDLVFKKNSDALLPAAMLQRHWVDNDELVSSAGEVIDILRQEFETGDRMLKQRMQQLEQKVAELQLSVLITEQKMTYPYIAASSI